MQMIDVLKRLVELDSTNPRVVKESDVKVDECGMMGMGEMQPAMPAHPPTPASINMTAGSADELGNLLKDIVSLAGMKTDAGSMDMPEPAGEMPPPAEPEMGPPESPADSMRSVIDKLNPMDDEEDGQEDDEEDSDQEDGQEDDEEETEGMLGTMAGAGLGAALGGPLGAALGGAAGDELTGDEEQEEAMDGPYDNSPTQANKPPSKDHDAMVNKGMHNQDPAGHPGAGDRMDGDRPKAFATFEDQLMWEYKKFIKG